MEWENILPSTIIAAVVTGIIELVKMNNSNKATYIISQREEWREKIRDIADDIYKADQKTIGVSLTKLKTRINSYGTVKEKIYSDKERANREYYLKDGHIYEVIKKLEDKKTNSDFKKQKSKLIDYLTLLLKFDWERAKIESSTNGITVISWILEIIAIVLLIIINLQNEIEKTIVSLCVSVAVLLFYFLTPLILELVLKNAKYSTETQKMKNEISILLLLIFVLITIVVCFNMMKDELFLPFSFMILAYSLQILPKCNEKYIQDYIEAIQKLEENSKEEQDTN